MFHVVLDNTEEGFIMIGDILDSVGVSNPNSNDLYFEKIIMEPSTFSIFNSPAKSAPSKLLGNFLKNVRDEDINSKDKDLSNTLRTLNKVKESFGVDSLKDFFAAIKGNLKEILDTAQKENIKLSGKGKKL